MAWTNPRTWVAGELVTASLFNTHIRDNENATRDYLLGAQDLGANWQAIGGRQFRFQASGVAHGMTAIVPTDVYGFLAPASATAGGIQLEGLSDTASDIGLFLTGIVGNATPTVPGIAFGGYKKNGTTVQAFTSSEVLFGFYNGGSQKAYMFGDGGFNIFAGGLAIGYAGTPTAATLHVGDTGFRMGLSGGNPYISASDSTPFGMSFDRAAGAGAVSISGVGLRLSISGSTGGVPEGAILFGGERGADPAAPAANHGILYLKDNGGGKTQLAIIFSSGAAQIVATQP